MTNISTGARTYVVANTGSATQQDGNELTPFVGFKGFMAVQQVAKPGDTILLRGPLEYGVVRFSAGGVAGLPLTVKQHPDGGCIDGHDEWPRGEAAWTGIDLEGNPTEAVHRPLLRITGDYVRWSVPVRNSRGRLVQLGDGKRTVTGSRVVDTQLVGARTAPVELRDTVGCGVIRCQIEDGSNYYPDRSERDINEKNFSGCIKLIDAVDSLIEGNRIRNHYGNVVTPGRGSRGAKVLNNEIHDCNGSLIYVEWCRDVLVEGNIMWYSPAWRLGIHSAIAINNEAEYSVDGHEAANIRIIGNVALGTSVGMAVWGNEGQDRTVAGIELTDNIFVNQIGAGLRTNYNAKFKDFVGRHNIFAGADKSKLLDLRSTYPVDLDNSNHYVAPSGIAVQRAENAEHVRRLAAVLRATYPFQEPEAQPVDPPKEDPRQIELRAWLAEADDLVPQLTEWLARGRALVG